MKSKHVELDLPVLLARFHEVRAATLALASGLSEEDCCVQAMPECSPTKWHLAHTSWFFETFILEKMSASGQFQAFHPTFKMLFNSYYQGVGEQFKRPQRGLLTRPSLAQVLLYRAHVEAQMTQLAQRIQSGGNATFQREFAFLLELGLQHEQQHQELMLTDIKYLFSCNPLLPAWRELAATEQHAKHQREGRWIEFESQLCEIGFRSASSEFCFDNELPRHRQFIEAYALQDRLVSNVQFLQFVQAGGYQDPQYWLAEGWDWLQKESIRQPLYWHCVDGSWFEFTLGGLQALVLADPVLHLSYFEAEAFARWAGARLATEAEWEAAANSSEAAQFEDMFGFAWQWTSSSYNAYPGFAPSAGAIGEYNGKFMVNQYVLRGSSCATPVGHARTSYRNFFPSHSRWQFTGIRLARSL